MAIFEGTAAQLAGLTQEDALCVLSQRFSYALGCVTVTLIIHSGSSAVLLERKVALILGAVVD
jgi:hypothetical protein